MKSNNALIVILGTVTLASLGLSAVLGLGANGASVVLKT